VRPPWDHEEYRTLFKERDALRQERDRLLAENGKLVSALETIEAGCNGDEPLSTWYQRTAHKALEQRGEKEEGAES
jgi:hypothetical protein